MKKIVIVAYSHGREGTSALMGILQFYGYCTSNKVQASIMNPKGFFEDPNFDEKIFNYYGFNNGDLSMPPTRLEIDKAIEKSMADDNFGKLFMRQISGFDKYALKAPRYLLLPIIEGLKSQFDIKVINISRQEKEHVNSVYRVWRNIDGIDNEKKMMRKREIQHWIRGWKQFGEEVLLNTSLSTMAITFEQIIENKETSIKTIGDYLNEKYIDTDIFTWIEPKLVNRRRLSWKW